MGVLENCIREDLNERAPRRMGILHPLKVVILNYAEDREETVEAQNHPQNPDMGTRLLAMSREVYIDQDDFMEVAPNKKFKRLVAGGEVRLRYSYVIRCVEVIRNNQGDIVELHCEYDPATLGADPVGRKVKGVIHWVSAQHAVEAEIRLYDRLFNHPTPDAAAESYEQLLNPDSLRTLTRCYVEPALAGARVGEAFQFEREGYFCLDQAHINADRPVFNRVVTLRDTWARIEQQQASK